MVKSTGICTGKLSKDGYTFHTMGRLKHYSLVELLRKQTGPQKDFFTQFSLCVVFKISMYIIWGSEAFWTGAQVQATQGKCAQLREKRRTLTDTYACITQSVKYNNLTRVMYENYFSSIFFFTISILMDFRYFVTLRFYGTIFESGCAFLHETLSNTQWNMQ